MKVHARDAEHGPLCGAGARWASSTITTSVDHGAVTCKSCRRALIGSGLMLSDGTPVPDDLIIRIDDVRKFHCARGIRQWAQGHGLDLKDFLANGIPATRLLAVGDAVAERVVRLTLEARNGRRG